MSTTAVYRSPTQLIRACRYGALTLGIIYGTTRSKYVKSYVAAREARGEKRAENPHGYHGPTPTPEEYEAHMVQRFGKDYTKAKAGKYVA